MVVGALLFLGCHGTLAWAQQWVASGVAALFLATIPIWMTLLDAWIGSGHRPGPTAWLGLLLGLVGVALLVGPGALGAGASRLGGIALLGAAFAWAAGSIATRRVALPSSVTLATGMELLAGGALLILVGVLRGEAGALHLEALTLRSVLGFVYMVVGASIIAFTAYIWLLEVSTPMRVASYAFVHPVVALFLGWAMGGEPLTARTVLACLVILAAVAAILGGRARAAGRLHAAPRGVEAPSEALAYPSRDG